MASIIFELNQEHTIIKAELNEKFEDVINRFLQNKKLNPSTVNFILNGKLINPQQTVESQMSLLDKQNRILKVFVYLQEEQDPNKIVIIQSKEIICPKCFEPCRIKTENNKFTLFGCVNNHSTEDIKINHFSETQKINLSNIICNKCKQYNKSDSFNNEFYRCLTCKINLCILCKSKHEANHIITNYDNRNYVCEKHNQTLIKYCSTCKKNICSLCDGEHSGHETLSFDGIQLEVEEAKKQLNQVKNEIDKFNNKIKGIIKELNELIDLINIYYKINENILTIGQLQNKNYYTLQNMKDIKFDDEIIKNVNKINNIKNIKEQLLNIYDLYKSINENSKAPVIGIDLGTSNYCVAVYQNDKVEIIPEDTKNPPLYITITDTDTIFGEESKERGNPLNTFFNIKRLIGLNFESEDINNWKKYWPFDIIKDPESNKPKLQINYQDQTKSFYIEEILAMELQKIKLIASNKLGKEVKEAVISVPNFLISAQRQIIKDAAAISGLDAKLIIGSTQLAGLYYEMERKNKRWGKTIIVIDLGGGSLNVSLMELLNGSVEVKAVNGAYNLGGEDFTNILIDYCIDDFKKKTSLDIRENPKAFKKLRLQCEKAKERLKTQAHVSIDIDEIMNKIDFNIKISKDKFEELCDDLFNKCIQVIDQLLKDPKIPGKKVDEIILIGGSSQIPKIQSKIKHYFNGKEFCEEINPNKPNKSVASGAAILAAKYSNVKSEKIERINLHDVIPFSFGIEVAGGGIIFLIYKNTFYPCKSLPTNINTIFDNQSSMLIKLYEGNNSEAKKNCLIGEMNFTELPPGIKGTVSIQIVLEVDECLNLNLIATETITKKEVKMAVNYEQFRLKKEYMDKLILDYKKEFKLNQKFEKIKPEIEKMFGIIMEDCRTSFNEIDSEKIEFNKMVERWYQNERLVI